MDWISHLLFSLSLGALLLKDRSRVTMVLVAVASLLPDVDMLWGHRSEIHTPLVLLAFAFMLSLALSSGMRAEFKYPAFFSPLLFGFWSHSALDIFLFDNSRQTIKNLANQIVSNESVAQNVQDTVMHYASADGIMLFYPVSDEKFSIVLGEENYVIVAGLILILSLLIFLWLHIKKD